MTYVCDPILHILMVSLSCVTPKANFRDLRILLKKFAYDFDHDSAPFESFPAPLPEENEVK